MDSHRSVRSPSTVHSKTGRPESRSGCWTGSCASWRRRDERWPCPLRASRRPRFHVVVTSAQNARWAEEKAGAHADRPPIEKRGWPERSRFGEQRPSVAVVVRRLLFAAQPRSSVSCPVSACRSGLARGVVAVDWARARVPFVAGMRARRRGGSSESGRRTARRVVAVQRRFRGVPRTLALATQPTRCSRSRVFGVASVRRATILADPARPARAASVPPRPPSAPRPPRTQAGPLIQAPELPCAQLELRVVSCNRGWLCSRDARPLRYIRLSSKIATDGGSKVPKSTASISQCPRKRIDAHIPATDVRTARVGHPAVEWPRANIVAKSAFSPRTSRRSGLRNAQSRSVMAA